MEVDDPIAFVRLKRRLVDAISLVPTTEEEMTLKVVAFFAILALRFIGFA